jgi:hypothetical protein
MKFLSLDKLSITFKKLVDGDFFNVTLDFDSVDLLKRNSMCVASKVLVIYCHEEFTLGD